MVNNHELEDDGMVFPHNFRKFGIPTFISFYVDIPHVHGHLSIITKPCIHKALVKCYQLWKSLSGSETHFQAVHPLCTQLVGNEIVNAPLSCYIVK